MSAQIKNHDDYSTQTNQSMPMHEYVTKRQETGLQFGFNSAQAREIKIPGAIKEEDKEFGGLADAWNYFHTGRSGSNNVPSHIYAANIMGLGPEEVKIRMNRTKALTQSYGYHLLGHQLPDTIIASHNWFENTLKNENSPLYWYSMGAFYLYENNDKKAREKFSKGIFTAAQLTKNDFEKLKKIGININWQGSDGNWIANAESLGQLFVWMDLNHKGKILDYLKKKKRDKNKGVYWNLGAYLISEGENGNDSIVKSLLNSDLYESGLKKFGFHSAQKSLYYKPNQKFITKYR